MNRIEPERLPATGDCPSPAAFPVGSAESRAAARALLDGRRQPPMRPELRVIVECIGADVDLAQSTCQRYIAGGKLFEVVDLNGAGELGAEELEAFVQRFPIARLHSLPM